MVDSIELNLCPGSVCMMPSRRFFSLVVFLFSLAAAMSLEAQVRVDLRLSKRSYVAHEPVLATVTITNHAGREILIHNEGAGRRTMSWLDFSLRNARGTTLSPITSATFRSLRIPAGQSVSRTIDLNTLYRVSDLGNYNGHAVVRMPGGVGIFNSNRVSFKVTKGHTIFAQRIGDPASRNVREFRVSTFNAAQKSSLYVHLVHIQTGRTLQAFKLGDALTFNKPQATVDGGNNLHVLFLTAPGVFAHARVSPDGQFLGNRYFKRAVTGQPTLQTLSHGEVAVGNAIPYDPKAEASQRAQIRRLSERPPLTYR